MKKSKHAKKHNKRQRIFEAAEHALRVKAKQAFNSNDRERFTLQADLLRNRRHAEADRFALDALARLDAQVK